MSLDRTLHLPAETAWLMGMANESKEESDWFVGLVDHSRSATIRKLEIRMVGQLPMAVYGRERSSETADRKVQ